MNYDGSHIEQLTDDQWEDGGPAWQPRNPASTAPQVATKSRTGQVTINE
jgi:hypothetical protein